MILIPAEEGFQLFDDVKSAFGAYRKMYAMIGGEVKINDVRERIMEYFDRQEYVFISDQFEKCIASERDKGFKEFILSVIREMRGVVSG